MRIVSASPWLVKRESPLLAITRSRHHIHTARVSKGHMSAFNRQPHENADLASYVSMVR